VVIWGCRVVTQRTIGRTVAVLLAVLATALTATAIVHAIRGGDGQPVRPLSVLFVGDSYTAGAGVQDSQDAYPELIAQNAHWDLHVDAQGATGFIADGHGTGNGDTSRLIDRLAAIRQNLPKVDLLIIDAGRNDLLYPTEEFAAALSEYLTQARKQWPDATIVEIFPAYVSSTPPDIYPKLLDEVKASLSAVHGILVDPFAEGWYTDANPDSMVIQDGVHPNKKGNIYIAERVIASLRNKGIIPAK
jgi:lysophospholipase L1-like esterase